MAEDRPPEDRPHDWTIRAAPPGIDIEMRGGRAEDGREYLVLALKAAPGLTLDQAAGALSPWMLMNPWQPWLEFWRAAWAPWLALAAPKRERTP